VAGVEDDVRRGRFAAGAATACIVGSGSAASRRGAAAARHFCPNLEGIAGLIKYPIDSKKREAIVQDIQKRVASKMYFMQEPGQALGFNIAQPWLQNFGLWRSKEGGSPDQENFIQYWYDESKKK